MAYTKGAPKPPGSGRKAGTPNKVNAELFARLQKHVEDKCGIEGYDPLFALAEIASDEKVDVAIRVKAHADVARYIHPQKKAVEVSGHEGGPIEVRSALVERLLSAMKRNRHHVG